MERGDQEVGVEVQHKREKRCDVTKPAGSKLLAVNLTEKQKMRLVAGNLPLETCPSFFHWFSQT